MTKITHNLFRFSIAGISAVILLGTIFSNGPLHNEFNGKRALAQSLPSHPRLEIQEETDELRAGGPAWDGPNGQLTLCRQNIDKPTSAGYAGWEWLAKLRQCLNVYEVLKNSDPTMANQARSKARGVLDAAQRSNVYGGLGDSLYEVNARMKVLGVGNGSNTTFTIDKPILPGSTTYIIKQPLEEVAYTCNVNVNCYIDANNNQKILQLNRWNHIISIRDSDNKTFVRDVDYTHEYKYGSWYGILRWISANRPTRNATVYVTQPRSFTEAEQRANLTSSGYIINGTTLTLASPAQSGWVYGFSGLYNDYFQTTNGLGRGRNGVAPDAGYQVRTILEALAEGYDRMYSIITPSERAEMWNDMIDALRWYEAYGYKPGATNNYTQGYVRALTKTMIAGEDDGGTMNCAETVGQTLNCHELMNTWLASVATSLGNVPGGHTGAGQYDDVLTTGIYRLARLLKQNYGSEPFTALSWFENSVLYAINNVKPDGRKGYEGDDHSNWPASSMPAIPRNYALFFPNGRWAGEARQRVADEGTLAVPPGPKVDYKQTFAKSWMAPIMSPIFTRSSWTNPNAVWLAHVSHRHVDDHTHRKVGSFYLTRGDKDLIWNAGGYAYADTVWHNTVRFRSPNIPTSPNQDIAGPNDLVTRYEIKGNQYVYSQADYREAYAARNSNREITTNEVNRARRSILYFNTGDDSGLFGVFDDTRTVNSSTDHIFTLNFPTGTNCNMSPENRWLTDTGNNTYSLVNGNHKLFMKVLNPVAATLNQTEVRGMSCRVSTRYEETLTGQNNNVFLHVFEATGSTQGAMRGVNGIIGENQSGQGFEVTIDANTKKAAFFSQRDTMRYTSTLTGQQSQIMTGLAPRAHYIVTVTSNSAPIIDGADMIASDQGTIELNFSSPGSAVVTAQRANLAQLDLTISADKTTVNPGEQITYTIRWENTGTEALTDIKITDPIPTGTLFVSADHGGVNNRNVAEWIIGSAAVGATGQVSLVVEVIDTSTVIPKFHYKLNETSGTTAYDSGVYQNHATIVGATPGTGGDSGSFAFNGQGSYIRAPYTTQVDTPSKIAISLWAKWGTNGVWNFINHAPSNASTGWRITQYENKINFGMMIGGSSAYITDPTPRYDNNWHHIFAQYNGQTVSLYVDGNQVASAAASGSISQNTLPITFGANSDNISNFVGNLDNIQIFDTSLTISQINDLFLAGR